MWRLLGFKKASKCWREVIVSAEMFNERLTLLISFRMSVSFLLTSYQKSQSQLSFYPNYKYTAKLAYAQGSILLDKHVCLTTATLHTYARTSFLGVNFTSGHSVGDCATVRYTPRMSAEMRHNQIRDMDTFSCFTMQISFYLKAPWS